MPRVQRGTSRKIWARRHDRCTGCGTTKVPHEARGLCTRCYGNRKYANNCEELRARRKVRSIQNDTYERRKDKVNAWKAANRDRYKKIKRDWYNRTKSLKFTNGMRVWVEFDGDWREGILRRDGYRDVVVRLRTGEELRFGVRRQKLIRLARPPFTPRPIEDHEPWWRSMLRESTLAEVRQRKAGEDEIKRQMIERLHQIKVSA